MSKPKQVTLFHMAPVESASKREMLRRNGGIREVEGVRLWRKRKTQGTASGFAVQPSVESMLPHLKKMR